VQDSSGLLVNPLEEHFLNLITPATPYYYNTLFDAYKQGADFPRGYPYSLRGGIPTAISIGHVVRANRGDAIASATGSPFDHGNICRA
jgi:Reversibly glycosylated polypeptide